MTSHLNLKIAGLVNRSRTLCHPADKKRLDARYYAHRNYTPEEIPLASVCEETLLKGFHFVPGAFKPTRAIRKTENWHAQQLFLVEWDHVTEATLAAFIAARPFVAENAWLVTESLRSRYDAPEDPTCNGHLRLRVVLCMPRAVNTPAERQWVSDALVKALPGCDTGSANSVTNGGLGRAGAASVKIGKIVDTDWFHTALCVGKKAAAAEQVERQRAARERLHKPSERAASGFTEGAGELPLAALAKADPGSFLASIGLAHTAENGRYQHWGRPEKPGDTALSVWQSPHGNWQIRVFATSIPVPPAVRGAMPFTRFYCYHERNTDMEGLAADTPRWKEVNAELASRGYGRWLSEEAFQTQQVSQRTPQPVTHARFTAAAPIPKGWRVEGKSLKPRGFKDTFPSNATSERGETQGKPPSLGEASPRYRVDPDFQHDTADLATQQHANTTAVVNWIEETENREGPPELLLLTSAAGTGKTTAAITNAEKLLYIAKTTEQADEVFKTLAAAGEDAYRHRPRMQNRDHAHWEALPLGLAEKGCRPCIAPETCNTLAARGHSPHHACQACPVFTDCKRRGYLSQREKERNAAKVIYAWDEAVACDAKHAEKIKSLCTDADILILDEVNPANLTQPRAVTHQILSELAERFRNLDTLEIYKLLAAMKLEISVAETATEALSGLQKVLSESGQDIAALDARLETFPVGCYFEKTENGLLARLSYMEKESTVPVRIDEDPDDRYSYRLHADEAVRVNHFHTRFFSLAELINAGLVPVSDPPRGYPRFFADFQEFIQTHPSRETAPMTFDPETRTLCYFLKPTLNHRRCLFMTASDTENHIAEVYRDTEINVSRHTGWQTAWHETTRVLQIATGAYLPRHSLLATGEKGAAALKGFATSVFDHLIHPTIEKGLKPLIVGPKAFLEIPECQALNDAAPETLINHHHAEGRNDCQDRDIAFIFHYEPNHHDIRNQARRIYRNPKDPLSFERELREVTRGGVTFKKSCYTDKRVQSVYDRECRHRIMQAIMRLRPNRNPNKIIVLLTAEPIDMPITPLPFARKDFERFKGDWQAFANDLQETADTEKQTRARILDCRAQGMSERAIAKKTGVSRRCVRKVTKVTSGPPVIRTLYNPRATHVTLQEKILQVLGAFSPKKTSEILAAVADVSDRHIKRELKRLVDAGEIVKIRHGVYARRPAAESDIAPVESDIAPVESDMPARALRSVSGGPPPPVTLRVQLLNLLAGGEKTTGAVLDALGNTYSVRHIKRVLAALVAGGEILRVGHGVYSRVCEKVGKVTSGLESDMQSPLPPKVPRDVRMVPRRLSGSEKPPAEILGVFSRIGK